MCSSDLLGLDNPTLGSDASIATDTTPVADVAADVPPGFTMVSFQQGTAGYSQGHDTYIDAGSPNASRGQDSRLRYRNNARWALIWFDGIFGSTQIPPGAEIQSAHLTIEVDQAGSTADLVEVTVPWDETTTYSTFGPTSGVDTTDLGPSVATIAQQPTSQTLDVSASLRSWSLDPTKNNGWITVAATGTDSQVRSNDDGLVMQRPHLVVVFKQ